LRAAAYFSAASALLTFEWSGKQYPCWTLVVLDPVQAERTEKEGLNHDPGMRLLLFHPLPVGRKTHVPRNNDIQIKMIKILA